MEVKMAKKNIVRITRHDAEDVQSAELRRLFGEDAEVSLVNETLPSDSKAFVARFDEVAANADVVEAVLPPNLLEAALKFSQFSKRGGIIIRASMNRVVDPTTNESRFTFDHYEKIVKVEVVTERL
jgi:hypothetical protein